MGDELLKIQELITIYELRLISAVSIFRVGKWAVKLLTNIMKWLMVKSDIADITLIVLYQAPCTLRSRL